MSYYFDVGTQNEGFHLDIAEIDPTNITMACWFNSDDVDNFYVPMGIADKDNPNDYHRIGLFSDNDVIRVASFDGITFRDADTTNNYTASTWYHAIGEIQGTNPRKIWLNGDDGNSGLENTPITVDNLDRISIGYLGDSTPIGYMQGYVAEVAVWLSLLSVAEKESLAAGYSPWFVQPQNLIFYAPLIRSTVDLISGNALTAIGDPDVSAHPRIIYPSKIWVPHIAAAVSGTILPQITSAYMRIST